MIELTAVTYGHGDDPVLEDISLRIADGAFVLVVGANGAGKTTLLDLCSGLIMPDAGSVTVNGTETANDPVAARAAIGRLFEVPADQLVGETVGTDVAFGPENLGLSREAITTRVEEALAVTGMAGRNRESIHALSGGERARVAMAGALAMEPEHLVLDEPTAGIDHQGRTAILDHLAALHADGMGIVLATHDLRDLHLADRVIGLDDGEVAFDDTPAKVTERLPEVGVRVPHAWPD